MRLSWHASAAGRTSRTADTTGDEAADTRDELESALNQWRAYKPPEWGKMGGTPTGLTLMYPAGSAPDDNYQRYAWAVPTSMRNVDGTSSARVVTIYPTPAEEEA